jgi:hypothetical protein
MIKYFVMDHSTSELFAVAEDELATRVAQERAAFFEKERRRFHVVHVTHQGDNTLWRSANLETDVEGNEYQVFNHETGQYEMFTSLSSAKTRYDELVNNFLNDYYGGPFERVTETSRTPVETLP